MAVLIGGSGSTGSSLLRRILNRNSRVFCGPETSLFCKKELFDDWDRNKYRILKRSIRGLRNRGWHLYNGIDLLRKENNWDEKSLKQLIHHSKSFQEFSEAYFLHSLPMVSNGIWIEKTPANAYSMADFSRIFNGSKVIHIYRNPYDTILSLHKRGFSMYYSVSLYLLNTAHALSVNQLENYGSISYEDLTENPLKSIQSLCHFIGIDFEEEMLETRDQIYSDDPIKIGEWNYKETDPIRKQSSKFESASEKLKNELLATIELIHIYPTYAIKNNLKHHSVYELCEALGYPQNGIGMSTQNLNLRKAKLKDQCLRVSRNYPNAFSNYPIIIKK